MGLPPFGLLVPQFPMPTGSWRPPPTKRPSVPPFPLLGSTVFPQGCVSMGILQFDENFLSFIILNGKKLAQNWLKFLFKPHVFLFFYTPLGGGWMGRKKCWWIHLMKPTFSLGSGTITKMVKRVVSCEFPKEQSFVEYYKVWKIPHFLNLPLVS